MSIEQIVISCERFFVVLGKFLGVGSADCCYMATVDVSFQGKI